MRLPFSVVTAAWVVAFLMIVGNTALSNYNLDVLVRNEQVVDHTYDVRQELTFLMSALKDAETGNRGFQLTGRENYLEPYATAHNDIPRHLAALRVLLADDPRHQVDLNELERLVADKLADLSELISLRRTDGLEKARALMLTDRGKRLMDEIRVIGQRMDRYETDLLAERAAVARETQRVTAVTNVTGGAIAVGMTVAAFVLVRRELGKRQVVVDALRESEARYRLLTEAIPQIVWNADARGRVTYFNTRWQEYTGMSVEAARANGWVSAVHPDNAPRVARAWQTTVEGKAERFSHEFRLRRADGETYRWFLSVAVPLRRADGSVDQWIGSLADIDDQKRTAETLEGLVRERTIELRRSNEELEQFAYVASHDLQEPLRKIQAFGDRLDKRCRDQLGDQGREYLDRIQSSTGRMRRLIDGLLSLSRVSTKHRPRVPVDLDNVLADVVADLEIRINQADGRVELGPLPTLQADPTQMRQLFQNLIGNAVKFQTPDVSPIVQVSAVGWETLPRDADPLPPPGTGWRIVVADNGIGFEQQFAGRIFEVFQRLHGRDEYEGTGIGLAICRKIVERHGGGITARGRPGHGAAFIIDLPVGPGDTKEQ